MFTFRRSLFPSRNELLAPLSGLVPPYFADMVIPVPDADGGINRKAYEAYDAKLFVLIDPYTNMAIGDLLEVIMNDKKVGELKVKDEHLNRRWFFFVPTDGLVPGRLFTCHYVLTRAGETESDDPSATSTVLLEIDEPAGDDEEPWNDWHSKLKMVGLPQDVIDNGVSKEWADNGVPMTITPYPNMAVGDIILVKWGSVFLLPHILTQAEVDDSVEIIVIARPEDIRTAGDSAALIIHYNICDIVFNWSEKWSKPTSVPVDAGVSRLDALIIKEADDGKIILADLDANPVTLQILIKTGDVFTAGDTLEITVIGTPIPGRPPQTFTVEATVRNLPYIHEIPVEYAFVKLFAQGTLDASYALHRQNGNPTLYSRRTFATVIGNPSLLPAPTISEVIGNILPVIVSIASVVIRYPGMTNGDVVFIIWLGTTSDGSIYPHEQEYTVSSVDQQAGILIIHVQAEHVIALNGGSLKLNYRVYNDTTGQYGHGESDYLRVQVGTVQGTYPAPEVEEEKDGVINPQLVYTQAHVIVNPVNWLKGDILTFHWIGPVLWGSTSGSIPITVSTIGKPVRFRVDAQFVTANIGFEVTVIYTLLHAATGKYSYSKPLTFIVGVPLGRLLPPKVVQALNDSLNPMHVVNTGVDIDCSYETMDEILDILKMLWWGTPDDGTSIDIEKPAEASGTVRFHLQPSVVGANIGRSVEVRYAVQRHRLWTHSEELLLDVLDFQDPETELPRPEVPESKVGELRVMELTGNATVLVNVWPYIALKQLVWLYIEGQAGTGPYRINLLTAHDVNSPQLTQGLNETLLKTELLKLLHGSDADVVCKVGFHKSTDENAAIVFPKLPLVIRQHYEYVTPAITTVKTALGTVIPDQGLTYDKRLTIEGTATRAEKVDVQIDGVSKGMPTVDADSKWTITVDLGVGLFRVVAVAQYEADDKVSKPRSFTIKEAKLPSITGVRDSKGPVGNNGTTYDNQVTVSVNADPGQKVQLHDGASPIGQPIDLDGSGNGSTPLSSLSLKFYSLKAKALYGDLLESPVHSFTVRAHLTTTLTSVRHSGGELGNGGVTRDASVTLSGAVTPGYLVRVYDNNAPQHTAPGNPSGVWTTTLGIGAGGHSVFVRAETTGQQSQTRGFTREVIPPLYIDQSQGYLSGGLIRHTNRAVTHPPAGASLVRNASGGVPPYRYYSETPHILEVDINSGRVIGVRNGSGRIRVTDSRGTSASYGVTAQNVWYIANYGGRYNWAQANNTAASAGGIIPSLAQWHALRGAYGNADPGQYAYDWYWTTDTHAWGAPWLHRPADGQTYGSNDNGKVGCIGVMLPAN